MFRTSFCPSSGAQDWDVFYNIWYNVLLMWYAGFRSVLLSTTCTRSAKWAKVCPKHVELVLKINKTVIVASSWCSIFTYLNWWCTVKHKSSLHKLKYNAIKQTTKRTSYYVRIHTCFDTKVPSSGNLLKTKDRNSNTQFSRHHVHHKY
jgi:hypothetical protein